MNRLRAFIMVTLALLIAPAQAFATLANDVIDMNVPGLVAIDRSLDGSMVSFSGEAIGEDLRADPGHRSVNVLEDGVAVGVYVTNEQAAQIEVFGDHGHRGATVHVIGRVNIACNQHGGEFDVHAEEFRVGAPGETIDRPINPAKAAAAALALTVAMVEARLYRRMRERQV